MALVNKLNIPQKIGGQAVIRAFCIVAAMVGDSEAGLKSLIMRHHKQQLQAWLKWYTKPAFHRFWKVLSALDLTSSRLISPLQRLASKFRPLEDLSSLEKFDTYTQAPWLASVTCVTSSRAEAILAAKNLSGPAIFTDSSARNGLVKI